MRVFLLLLSLVLPLSSFATEKVSCICQIGLEPRYQRGFFEKGCKKWLAEQSDCDSQAIIDESSGHELLPLGEDAVGGTLKLGYVGHWVNSIQSVNYFQQTIAPTMNKFKVKVFWDNTACRGLDEPETFLKWLQMSIKMAKQERDLDVRSNQIQENIAKIYGKKFESKPVRELPFWMTAPFFYRANQVISIGMWDRYLQAPTSNLWAIVSFPIATVTLPKCEEFSGQSCFSGPQTNETGRCMSADGEAKSLVCCANRQDTFSSDNRAAIWQPGSKCQ